MLHLIKNKRYSILITSIILFYLLVAFNSTGYYHWDEHYQIIEFANYKLGKADYDFLPWEFKQAVRPSLQPWLCFLFFKLCGYFGVHNPFDLTILLRIATGTFAIFTIYKAVLTYKIELSSNKLFCTLLCVGYLWFLPFINVRFSAETYSGLAIVWAFLLTRTGSYKINSTKLLLLSFCLSLSILFKYQSALAVAGIIAWIVFIDKAEITTIIKILLIVVILLGCGVLFDRWMYGRYVFTLYNYFYVNLIEGVASNFGTSPWYVYLIYIISEPGPVIGLIICLSILFLLYFNPKNLILWIIIPYIAIHSAIPHKELRFLFPLANLIPFILLSCYQQYVSRFVSPSRLALIILLLLCSIVNITGLIFIVSKGAGKAKIDIANYIDRAYPNNSMINMLYIDGANPYQEWDSPKNTFYIHKNLKSVPLVTIWDGTLKTNVTYNEVTLLIIPISEMTGAKTIAYLRDAGFELVFQNIPSWMHFIKESFGTSEEENLVFVFEYKGIP